MFAIGALIFVISTAGFFLFLHRRLAVSMEFVPAIFCVSCVCFLFFAGILNFLPEMTWCLAGAGVILFLRQWKDIGKLSKRSWIVLTCYALALVYGAYLLVKVPLNHYDDFSHWGLVIREMLKDDRFPNFSDTLITFQAYPLGSAIWVYYVCRLSGGEEGLFLLAQQILRISFLLPVFAGIRKENRFLIIPALGYVIFALIAGTGITNLLVDSLLPSAAVALFAIFCYTQQDTKRAVLLAAPMVFFLFQVKNSGIFFVILFWVWAGARLRKAPKSERKAFLLWDILFPCTGVLLWQKHVQLVFAGGSTAKHAMTIANYQSTMLEKNAGDVLTILEGVVGKSFHMDNGSFWLLVVVTAALVLLFAWNIRLEKKRTAVIMQLCINWGIYCLYMLGIWGMYIFSMPEAEAMTLAGFDRYSSTCGIFLYGVNTIWLIRNLGGLLPPRRFLAVLACAIAVMLPFWSITANGVQSRYSCTSLLVRSQRGREIRSRIEQSLDRYGWFWEDARCIVYQNEKDDGYLYYVLRYETGIAGITTLQDLSEYDTLTQMAEDAEYFLIWTPDVYSDQLLKESNREDICGEQGAIVNLMSLQEN